MYVVTELAEQTLKSYLQEHYERKRPLPVEEVRKIAKEVTLAMAGLHAKGLVHMDMKPENIMRCSGRWKLIDMDGCFKIGSLVEMNNAAVSFSPCYCSPEFARFVNGGDSIVASPALDVWSIGMTLAELVELNPLFRATYQQIAKGMTRKQGSTRFLKWLGQLSSAPKLTKACDSSFQKLLQEALLVPKQANRMTLAESLSAPFFS
jgi:serine/threonine protein kinase